MITIELHNILLHGYHGIHQEEKKVMNTFEVNLDVSYLETGSEFDSIEESISYTDLYEIVRQKVQVPVFLLEKICLDIIEAVKEQYPIVKSIRISIHKLQAPIENFQGKVGVSMHREFDDSTKS
jgi:7,8-dihydroneopterin aldolase/epimerase/oxygenase